MEHSPMMKMVGLLTWAITAVFSINALAGLYGYDFINYMMGMMPGMMIPMIWIVGISGLISLAMLIKATFMCCPE